MVLQELTGVQLDGKPTHDELQATVAGVAGSRLRMREWSELSVAGIEPFLLDGSWREGYILNPAPAT